MALSQDDVAKVFACPDQEKELLYSEDKCDKYDYLVAAGCGAIGGLIDIFLVGAPGDSKLGNWTDSQVDKAVKAFAKLCGWNPKPEKVDNVASAIGFLENKFRVNYDQRHSGDVDNMFKMSPKNHHMMSLAHSPDIVGLFFSILDQFTSTSTFIANGTLITISTQKYKLEGRNFVSKIFCGIANWFGHIMSDVAGSSGGRGNGGRGSGVVIPFYEFFGFCKFGKFKVGDARQDLATIATRAFQEGYDFRHGLAMAIPVIITDLSIRLVWALRRYFQSHKPLEECIPTQKHADLRVMLLFGNGTLCVMDGIDAGIRSNGNFLTFFMRMNVIAWFRFVTLILKEICIRLGIAESMQQYLLAYKRINEVLLTYLQELEKIDIEEFALETENYNKIIQVFKETSTNEELKEMLVNAYDRMGLSKPWQGEFDEHMADKNATLFFE